MIKSTLAFAITFSVFIFIPACRKSNNDSVAQQTTTPILKKNQSFAYDFGLIGIEDGLTISQQAKHFETSTLQRDNGGNIMYYYKPQLDYVGNDDVVITLSVSNGGAVVRTTATKINFTIKN
jgi:hypothetical protein